MRNFCIYLLHGKQMQWLLRFGSFAVHTISSSRSDSLKTDLSLIKLNCIDRNF